MSKIMVDPQVIEQLKAQVYPVELCDESGCVVGTFLPAFDPSKWEGTEPQVSEEELDRRCKAGGGRTLPEILNAWKRRK